MAASRMFKSYTSPRVRQLEAAVRTLSGLAGEAFAHSIAAVDLTLEMSESVPADQITDAQRERLGVLRVLRADMEARRDTAQRLVREAGL